MATSTDQLLANLASASQALQTASTAYSTARGLWDASLNKLGILPTRKGPSSRKPLPAPPATIDLNVLGNALAAAVQSLQAAQTAFNTAQTAYNAAVSSAGVVTTVSSSTATSVTSS